MHADDLHAQKFSLSSLVISGHSAGNGQFGGLFGSLTGNEVKEALEIYPDFIASLHSVLLWGCYTGTLDSLENFWRKNFPTTEIFAGYEDRAPLGIRESSGRYLKSLLLSEARLVNAHGPTEIQQAFRAVDGVADLDGAAIVHEYYLTYDQIDTVDEMLRRCQAFDERLLGKFECYDNGNPGCENPPPDHQGDLRELYSFLQINRHCLPILKQKYPSLPSTDYLVRLIFLDAVKSNFNDHYKSYFEEFRRVVGQSGLPAEFSIDHVVNSTRADDMKLFSQARSRLNSLGLRDGTIVDHPGWSNFLLLDMGFDGTRYLLGAPEFHTSSAGGSCVPFSWVDPGSREEDSCGLKDRLPVSPMPASIEAMISDRYFDLKETTHILFGELYIQSGNMTEIRSIISSYFQYSIKGLEGLKDRTPVEDARLVEHRRRLAEIPTLADRAFGLSLIADFDQLSAYLSRLSSEVQSMPNPDVARGQLEQRLKIIENARSVILKALPPG